MLKSFSVSTLKRMMKERGISFQGCLEKKDLIDRLQSATSRQQFSTKIEGLNVGILENGLVPDVIVILLHGLGSNNEDMIGIANSVIGAVNRTVRFICVDGPNQVQGETHRYSWFQIDQVLAAAQKVFLGGGSVNSIVNQTPEGLVRSSKMLSDLISNVVAHEASYREFAHDCIILGGFSQGATVSLDCALMYPHETPFKALKLWSGIALRKNQLEESRETPAISCFVSHGKNDPMVPLALGMSMKDVIAAKVPQESFQWHEFPGGHTLAQHCLHDLRKEINSP